MGSRRLPDGAIGQCDVACITARVVGDLSCAPPYADPDFNPDGCVDQSDIDGVINAAAGGGCL